MKPYLYTSPDWLRLTARCQQAINVSGEDCFLRLSGELNDGSSILTRKHMGE